MMEATKKLTIAMILKLQLVDFSDDFVDYGRFWSILVD